MTKGSSYDTRFLVELYYSTDRNQQARIKEILLRTKLNYMSTAVLSEIYIPLSEGYLFSLGYW